MVNFRRMRIGDLDSIYRDPEIRSIITTSTKEPKFAVVIEEDRTVLGGASGYVVENAAFMQRIAIKKHKDGALYKDGLIRSMIHFLELDGVDFLFVGEGDSLYEDIGFYKLRGNESLLTPYFGLINDEFADVTSVYWISTKSFFENNQ
jgi:hypothetical protein